MKYRISTTLVACLVPVTTSWAQQPEPVAQRVDCRLATQVVVTGVPAPRMLWASQVISRCGAEAGAAVSKAMDQARGSSDMTLLARLHEVAATLRDGAIVETALDVFADQAASPEARIYSARTLVFALQPNLYMTYAQLAAGDCYGSMGGSHTVPVRTGAPLPTQYAARAKGSAAAVFADSTLPLSLRRAGRCVALHDAAPFREADPEAPGYLVVSQDLTIAYVCGNSFRIHNPFAAPATVRYRLDRTSERGTGVVPENGEWIVVTRQMGRVHLLDEDGYEIASADNLGTACVQ